MHSQKEILAAIRAERELQLSADLRELMPIDQFRRVVSWLIYELGGLETISFKNGDNTGHVPAGIKYGDAMAHTIFNDGRRDMAADIQATVLASSPDEFCALTVERAREAININARLTPSAFDQEIPDE